VPASHPTAAQLTKDAPPELESLTADEVVAWAVQTFGSQVALACSFQQEESVLLDMLAATGSGGRAFALDTGLLFPETYATQAIMEQRFGITVEAERGISLEEQAELHGAELWKSDPAACCAIRKVEPLKAKLATLDAWITGIRREQSPTRADSKKLEWDSKHDLWKINPLADWSQADVWQRISERDLPYHPLHDEGYASIGCIPCTAPGAGREGRWAGSQKTECGLHE
jgi:phosphoadenosine phosphosulfate reductase